VPLIRKLTRLRTSRAVCLPKDWLEYIERKEGVEIKEVAIEVDEKLQIFPIIPKRREQTRSIDQ